MSIGNMRTTTHKAKASLTKTTATGVIPNDAPVTVPTPDHKDAKRKTAKVKSVSAELREMGREALREHDAGLNEVFPV